VLEDPSRGSFRKAPLAGTSDNDGNDAHAFAPCCYNGDR
jgi:hypothetical protein